MFSRLLGDKYTGSNTAAENPLFKYETPAMFEEGNAQMSKNMIL